MPRKDGFTLNIPIGERAERIRRNIDMAWKIGIPLTMLTGYLVIRAVINAPYCSQLEYSSFIGNGKLMRGQQTVYVDKMPGPWTSGAYYSTQHLYTAEDNKLRLADWTGFMGCQSLVERLEP